MTHRKNPQNMQLVCTVINPFFLIGFQDILIYNRTNKLKNSIINWNALKNQAVFFLEWNYTQ